MNFIWEISAIENKQKLNKVHTMQTIGQVEGTSMFDPRIVSSNPGRRSEKISTKMWIKVVIILFYIVLYIS